MKGYCNISENHRKNKQQVELIPFKDMESQVYACESCFNQLNLLFPQTEQKQEAKPETYFNSGTNHQRNKALLSRHKDLIREYLSDGSKRTRIEISEALNLDVNRVSKVICQMGEVHRVENRKGKTNKDPKKLHYIPQSINQAVREGHK